MIIVMNNITYVCYPSDLVNVFETFLPQLLRYPNPSDPLNGEAANLLLRDPTAYNKRIQEYVQKYACGGAKPVADEKVGEVGPRKDSAATATTAESVVSETTTSIIAGIEGDGYDGYMSDASELSDL